MNSGFFDHVFRDEGWGTDRSAALLERIENADKILIIGSRKLKERYDNRKLRRSDFGVVSYEMDAIRISLFEKGKKGVILFHYDYSAENYFPTTMRSVKANSFSSYADYYDNFFAVLEKIYDFSDYHIAAIKREFMSKKINERVLTELKKRLQTGENQVARGKEEL